MSASISVLPVFRGQNVFITGATGFVGKAVVEKLCRSVTECGKLFLMIRGRKGEDASTRMQREIIQSPIFDRLREEFKDFDTFISNKLVAINGDLTLTRLGISDVDYARLTQEVGIIIHCAATVDFAERLDRALDLNLFGSMRMLDLAKACVHLKSLVHVSTCYVNSNRRGWVEEKLYDLGIEAEDAIAQIQKLNLQELEQVTDSGFLGKWPNTYTYTKALTEQILMKNRGHVPIAIVRPSIITPALTEPVPGWVDVISAAGAIYAAVFMGVLRTLPGHPDSISDCVPVDYVVNACLAAAAEVAITKEVGVYQASSSVENTMTWQNATEVVPHYFATHQPKNAVAPASFKLTRTPQQYNLEFFFRYSCPSAILNTFKEYGPPSLRERAHQFNKLVWRVRLITESFRFFTENQWQFDNKRIRSLGERMVEQDIFPLKLADIDWFHYTRVCVYGLLSFVFREPIVPMGPESSIARTPLSFNIYKHGTDPDIWRKLFPDASWSYRNVKRASNFGGVPRPIQSMKSLIINSPNVQQAIQLAATERGVSLAKVEEQANSIAEKMFADSSAAVLGGMAVFFRKVFRRMFRDVQVETAGVEWIKTAREKGPIIYVPTHRSYIDFLVLSYMCFHRHLPMPYIAAGEDFLGILMVRWLFRKSGAFFLKRSFTGDRLYSAIFSTYVQQLLVDSQAIEFFIEGTRSRSGKMLHPKLGLLNTITSAFFDGKLSNASLVPISINYEKIMESNLFGSELEGNQKLKESLWNLLKSRSVLNVNFGQISITIGKPIALDEFTNNEITRVHKQGFMLSPYTPSPIYNDADDAKITNMIPLDADGYNPFDKLAHRKYFNRCLGYQLVHTMNTLGELHPTHLVAALLLMYRQGITHHQLVSKTHWLKDQVVKRGGRVGGFEMNNYQKLVDQAVQNLGPLVIQRTQNLLEPAIVRREQYKNMLTLGLYRNKMVHFFFLESLFATALYSLCEHDEHAKEIKASGAVRRSDLLREAKFLYALMRGEFIYKAEIDEPDDLNLVLQQMITDGILRETQCGDMISVDNSGERIFAFLCAVMWPFIDSYYVTALILFSLQPDRALEEFVLLQRIQWLATTLYHEQMVCFYESCSMDTLKTAFIALKQLKVVQLFKEESKLENTRYTTHPSLVMVRLTEQYQSEEALSAFVERIGKLRKSPPVKTNARRRNLIADIPILAKM